MAADPLSDVVEMLHVRVEVHTRALLNGPWSVRLEPDPLLAFHVLEMGKGWLITATQPPLALAAGDVIMLRPGIAHDVCASPGLAPRVVISPQSCSAATAHVDRSGGNAEAVLVCGRINPNTDVRHPLIDALPDVLHLPAATAGQQGETNLLTVVSRELHDSAPGWQVVVDNLSNAVFV